MRTDGASAENASRAGYVLTLLAGILLAGGIVHAQSSERLPVPNSAAQGKILRDLKQQFKAEYAKRTPADQAALCKQFVEQVPTYSDNPSKQYVLLREARELAVNAGDLELAFSVIDQTAKLFTVDATELKVSAMTAAVDRSQTPMTGLLEQYMRIANDALDRSDLDLAQPAKELAVRIGRGLKNPALSEGVKKIDLRVHDLRRMMTAASEAATRLRSHPDDPQANLLVGRFICFHRNAWDEGLPLLARGSDRKLKELAAKDLQGPNDASAMVDLADAWWDYPDSPETPSHGARTRAVHWYQEAVSRLSGEKKDRAQKRIAEVLGSDTSK